MKIQLTLIFILSCLLNWPLFAHEKAQFFPDCESNLKDLLKSTNLKIKTRDRFHNPLKGFAKGSYQEGHQLSVSLVLETKDTYYFYYEACDICADLVKCSKNNQVAESYKSDHSLSCSDLPQVDQRDLIYTDCP